MKKVIIIMLGILAILGVAGFFIFTNLSKASGNAVNNPGSIVSEANTVIIYVNASRFTYSPDVIKVKKGEHVRMVINNIDTAHGIVIPDLGVNGLNSVEFTADKAGTYEFRCPTMCGQGHREMTGTLIVE